jgi:hypothetical protein
MYDISMYGLWGCDWPWLYEMVYFITIFRLLLVGLNILFRHLLYAMHKKWVLC